MRLPGFRGETPSDRIELPVAQRTDQVAPECNPISITSRQPLLRQGIDPPIKCRPDLGAKAGAREIDRLTSDEATVEPGCPARFHLLVEIEVRADRKRDPLPAPRVLKPPQLYNAADRTVARRFDFRELQVMHPSVDAVDHGEGRPPKFIVEAAGNEPTGDGFAVGFTLKRPE